MHFLSLFLQQQEEAANKEKEEDKKEEAPDTGPTEIKHQSIAQIIYAENRVSQDINLWKKKTKRKKPRTPVQ